MKEEYLQFLEKKVITNISTGIDVGKIKINPMLFDFQRDIVVWALRRGRAAIFGDCGLGKTPMQLEWSNHIYNETKKDILIVAPLVVAKQTQREGDKFGIAVNICCNQSDVRRGINITNYEMLSHFQGDTFGGVVLDESSILKSYSGKIRNSVIEMFSKTPYKLACTATPSPNDYMELGNHSEFLGILSRTEMLSMFFVHDGGDTAKWRIKGHVKEKIYWEWVASWSVMLRKPSDLGYIDNKFILPKLNIKICIVQTELESFEFLPRVAVTLEERRDARKISLFSRVDKCIELLENDSNSQWLFWCDYNVESMLVYKKLRENNKSVVEITGSDSIAHKEKGMMDFSLNNIRCLVTKPSIAGFGMNWQNCHNVVFVGLSDSYEQFYQAIRRCWRFGQDKEVNVYVIIGDREVSVLENIKRKEKDAENMMKNMIENIKDISKKEIVGASRKQCDYKICNERGDRWEMVLGDCVDIIKREKDNSIHYSIFSPPFSSLYTYSNSERDMGNCSTHDEFYKHFRFLVKDLYRILMPGRVLSFHCSNLTTSKEREGVIGLVDFRGELIRLFIEEGFIYHSEVCIWKDPVTAMQRTKALGLLHKQLKKDSCMSRQGIPDYLVTMQKPGKNLEKVTHTNESFPVNVWQNYASPIWMDIRQSDTLQRLSARENEDERHICPLQLEVIKRGIELWTNPKDIVFSPFAGIGSEGYVALQLGRKFKGIELKERYFECAVNNLKKIEHELIVKGIYDINEYKVSMEEGIQNTATKRFF